MRFGVLGPLEVLTDDGRPVPVPELKVRLLLSALLAAGGRPVSSGRLIQDLWGDEPPADPAAALRAKVSQLRRALDVEDGGRALVRSRPPGYVLASENVDARSFQADLARAHGTTDPAAKASLLTNALTLWRGTPFADFADEDFARGPAARLDEQRLTALEELAEARLALGEHHALVAELTDLADRHPLRERVAAALMLALYRSGRQHEALDHHRRLRDRLRDEMGLDPGPELAGLHQAILRQDPGLQAPAPAPLPRSNLPVPLTDLIGRSTTLDEVVSRIKQTRLMTLTGPGGVGKTTLALEAARRLRDTHPDGVFLIELAELPRGTVSADKVAEVVAEVVGLRQDSPDATAERLGDRRALLVLDNCEHVADPVAELAAQLLRSGPELRILATGREPLGVPGERLYAVQPLDVPHPAENDPATLANTASVQLFTTRAAAAAPGFTLDPTNSAAVAAICRRLDGIPLALELAAARVRALGTETLAARLDDRFRLLRSPHRDAPWRQRTLRAAIDWSWEPLDGTERAVLRRLSAHPGGCTLEAAEQTCAGDGVDAAEVMDVIVRLVDGSLVMASDGPGGVRYRLLESVAAYAEERLEEAGEQDDTEQRRDEYYVLLAECAEEYRTGPARQHWLARLDAETANLRRSLESAGRRQNTKLALRLTAALAWYRIERGRTKHTSLWLGEALAEAATAHHLDRLTAARLANDATATATALEGLAGAQILAGHGDRAARLLGTAATIRPIETPDGVRILTAARTMLTGGAFTTAFQSGRTLAPEQATADLLKAE
ncbi:AfsR/SARP family transcriptional regulator [Actinomadura sp. KC216]|uniref:BTAD domain-containing putative transcriptional regulator n=1 Tax=Actinomadura sp. KC216 TaxID=2530370 RepID=UPI001048C130|nr:BTAD domain-containing putative transcriptional regulator [Actinomadura sp. KC216]TDB89182.1 AfsR/SARP family transcriptional regulator [Actinomadura sp. KC216]